MKMFSTSRTARGNSVTITMPPQASGWASAERPRRTSATVDQQRAGLGAGSTIDGNLVVLRRIEKAARLVLGVERHDHDLVGLPVAIEPGRRLVSGKQAAAREFPEDIGEAQLVAPVA